MHTNTPSANCQDSATRGQRKYAGSLTSGNLENLFFHFLAWYQLYRSSSPPSEVPARPVMPPQTSSGMLSMPIATARSSSASLQSWGNRCGHGEGLQGKEDSCTLYETVTPLKPLPPSGSCHKKKEKRRSEEGFCTPSKIESFPGDWVVIFVTPLHYRHMFTPKWERPFKCYEYPQVPGYLRHAGRGENHPCEPRQKVHTPTS